MSNENETPMARAAREYRAERDRREPARPARSNVVPIDMGWPHIP